MKKRAKSEPSLAEKGAHQKDVAYKGRKYRLSVSEKVAADGVIETHLDYDAHDAPRQPKRRATSVFNQKTKKWEKII